MSFEQMLSARAARVETHLAAALESQSRVPARLAGAMRHALLGGGKRFRPYLVLESAALCGVDAESAMAAACAVECVHCYSLVHDDLPAMDNDAMRRGRPAVWKAFDEWTAILAGDALLTLAFEIMGSTAVHPDPAIRSDLVAGLASAAGPSGMVGGQCLDLEAGKLGRPAHAGVAQVQLMHAMKTGALVVFACEAGAILGRAGPPERGALRRYGESLGLAYQMADDLLDVEGDAAAVGKTVLKDAAAGKATLVALLGADTVRARLRDAEEEAVAALASFGGRAGALAAAARFVSRRER